MDFGLVLFVLPRDKHPIVSSILRLPGDILLMRCPGGRAPGIISMTWFVALSAGKPSGKCSENMS